MCARTLIILCSLITLTACFGMGNQTPAPVVHHGSKSGAGSAGVHTVSYGETLYSISKRYRMPMRDITVLNRVQPPFKLYEGQRLKLPPPREYRVRLGDTLYEISRLFGVNSSEIARMNNIQSPYIVRSGQMLRLPSITRKTKVKAVKVASNTSSTPGKAAVNSVKSELVSPSSPKPAFTKDGVPIPSAKPKPAAYTKPKSLKVAKVTTKTPKRASSTFLKPVRGRIISNFGAKKSGLHNDGINIAAARGAAVKSAENGVVVYAGNALKGSGNLVLVRHEKRWMTAYAHLDKIKVRKGQVLKRGQSLGTVGSSGSVSTPQLHFEVRRGTSALNPKRYLSK